MDCPTKGDPLKPFTLTRFNNTFFNYVERRTPIDNGQI
jgi:hypothetical protein